MRSLLKTIAYLSATAVITGAATAALSYGAYRVLRYDYTYLYSKLATEYSSVPNFDPNVVKDPMLSLPMPAPVANDTNPHAQLAADRSAVNLWFDAYAAALGRTRYDVSMSRSNQRRGMEGCRSFYEAKDVSMVARNDPVLDHHLVTMVDVDYYCDIPYWLLKNSAFVPFLIYTMSPAKSAESTKEYSYCYTDVGQLDFRVTGGGHYVHWCWDYNTDNMLVHNMFENRARVYKVDRIRHSSTHVIVLITPIREWSMPAAWFMPWLLNHKQPGLFTPVQSGTKSKWTVTTHYDDDGCYVSIARLGCPTSVEVPMDTYNQLLSRRDSTNARLTSASVDALLHDRAASHVVCDYFQDVMARKPRYNFTDVGDRRIRHYQWVDKHHDPDAKETMVAYMDGVVLGGAFAPKRSDSNNACAVARRLERVRSDAEVSPQLYKRMLEFVALLFGDDANTLTPVSFEEVAEKQSRPSQRVIYEQAMGFENAVREIRAFMKVESYMKIADPRIISTINGPDKINYSCYTLALAAYVSERHRWYAFGKTPRELSDCLGEVLINADTAVETDYSRFDGRVSPALRTLERMIYQRAFRSEFVNDVAALHDTQFNLRGQMGLICYNQGTSRASGSPETAVLNTLVNAFGSYIALRMDGHQPDAAFEGLGIYGGDDGLTADVSEKAMAKSAELIGQVMTVETKNRSQPVKFLSRWFGEAWMGSGNSMVDPIRALAKFHVTHSKHAHLLPLDKLRDKAYALFLTDRNTLTIGPYVSYVVSQLNPEQPFDNINGSWWARYADDSQWVNRPADWMDDVWTLVAPDFEHHAMTEWILAGHRNEALLNPPVCLRLEPQLPNEGEAEVDDEHLVPRDEKPEVPRPDKDKPPKGNKTSDKAKPNAKPSAPQKANKRQRSRERQRLHRGRKP